MGGYYVKKDTTLGLEWVAPVSHLPPRLRSQASQVPLLTFDNSRFGRYGGCFGEHGSARGHIEAYGSPRIFVPSWP